ncbi:uncharacterized protein EV154DRAFT_548288 [Mucor mucedo]|uniref:uncharacterized protein n=1 Tax=Mucor mucedo TaxID=29922 RepID=UPI00221FF094|nr:uncharacterized protein EV154DRAFT_548288 [Mucor mucedo]KAI7895302.1 hypothetical protein EV154DRAFT_548288 [Mucor mucedo]
MFCRVVSSLNLVPVITYANNVECGVLSTTKGELKRLLKENDDSAAKILKFEPVHPDQLKDDDCKCQDIEPTTYINNAIENNQYRNVLIAGHFEEISESQLESLNSHWRGRPYMPMFCAHFLLFRRLLRALLPSGSSLYSNCYLDLQNLLSTVIMNNDSSRKLVIGTTKFNALVVSSIRLDGAIKPEVGPSTFSFFPSGKTKVYVSEDSAKKASRILADKRPNLDSTLDPAAHLRQLRSGFNFKSTFIYARFHSMFASNHFLQFLTIFTHINSNYQSKKDDILGILG